MCVCDVTFGIVASQESAPLSQQQFESCYSCLQGNLSCVFCRIDTRLLMPATVEMDSSRRSVEVTSLPAKIIVVFTDVLKTGL
jgi:hypothetical protein